MTARSVPDAARELRHLHDTLAAQASLAPGPVVDDLFGRLVALVVALRDHEARYVLADPALASVRAGLHRLCARGEAELERAWAARIAASGDPRAELRRFPYHENYRMLTRLEWSALLASDIGRPRRVAFVGAGPLPLSLLTLVRHHDVAVDGFDRDRTAVALAGRVLGALGARRARVLHADALRCPDLRAYDAVVLAALVGPTPAAKRAVLAQLRARMRRGAVLIARSAHGARSLLYPTVALDAFAPLELLTVVHPLNEVINSVVVARKTDEVSPCRGS